jgi:hypothetical protein
MGQGQSAPSGIPASAAAVEPVAPKRTNSPSQSVPNVLGGQTGGRGSRHLRQKIRNKHMKSRKNRSNRSTKH